MHASSIVREETPLSSLHRLSVQSHLHHIRSPLLQLHQWFDGSLGVRKRKGAGWRWRQAIPVNHRPEWRQRLTIHRLLGKYVRHLQWHITWSNAGSSYKRPSPAAQRSEQQPALSINTPFSNALDPGPIPPRSKRLHRRIPYGEPVTMQAGLSIAVPARPTARSQKPRPPHLRRRPRTQR